MSLPVDFKEKAIEAFKEAEYQEIFGLEYDESPEKWTKAHLNVLLKFYVANEKNIHKAKDQLVGTLKWRKEYDPLKAATETFDANLEKLGVVTKSPDGRVVTWNLYGAVTNPGELFKDYETFVRWRVGLHERALALLDFNDDKLGQMDQVHDYMNVSFLRMDSNIRKTSSKVIELFQSYYPETLNGKWFVNVPYIMMWAFRVIRSLVSEATTAKFHVLANGDQLHTDFGDWVPKAYGGKAESLDALAIKIGQSKTE